MRYGDAHRERLRFAAQAILRGATTTKSERVSLDKCEAARLAQDILWLLNAEEHKRSAEVVI